MSVLRLGLCVLGVYSMFLLWAVAQERLSVPFQHIDGQSTDKFKSPFFLGTCQSFLSSLSALAYIVIRGKSGSSLSRQAPPSSSSAPSHTSSPTSKVLLLRYLQVSAFITLAASFGFATLSYLTYPTMVLGKSCKLVPVMLMNFVMYRRRFAPHKYIVVAMVTVGIRDHMAKLIGILYLLVNLILDGAVNSTQDEVFVRYKVTGQQMMFWINLFCTLLSTALGTLPLPHIPVLHPSGGLQSEFPNAIGFIRTHPSVIVPLVQFSLTGALGQLFIFETLQHFGSLTLVMITLTRKMFTMVLSVVVYDHKLTLGQWAGAGIVFGGISVEAWVKRKEVHAKRVLQEKEKAKIKSL
ncbi:UDP-galactose transporter [Suillus occidentalis]|nr:UDP-galactose transporter [Suillus occidentalis]